MSFVLLDRIKAQKAFETLYEEYPDAAYYLDFKTPLQLLVAAILSAQTKDEMINALTPKLFEKYKTAEDFANADEKELGGYIKSATFFGNKAKNIIKTCKAVSEKYGGKVPNKLGELVDLPGVGKKTANTVLINAYGIVSGIPVDTWVIKLTHRIGISNEKDPDRIEEDLEKLLDRRYWHNAAYVFKAHGRKVCKSAVPVCSMCILNKLCPKNDVKKST